MAAVDYGEYAEWSLALDAAARDMVPGQIIRLQKSLAFLTLGAAVELAPSRYVRLQGVVLLTPVDTGRARASWNVAVGSPDSSIPPARRGAPSAAGAEAAQEQARARLVGLGTYQTVWITSSLVYMRALEFGGYPNPPKLGTWDRRQRRYVVRSAGGYSKQAPQGMVRLTFAAIQAALGDAVAVAG